MTGFGRPKVTKVTPRHFCLPVHFLFLLNGLMGYLHG